jgi:hypothetical protein
MENPVVLEQDLKPGTGCLLPDPQKMRLTNEAEEEALNNI